MINSSILASRSRLSPNRDSKSILCSLTTFKDSSCSSICSLTKTIFITSAGIEEITEFKSLSFSANISISLLKSSHSFFFLSAIISFKTNSLLAILISSLKSRPCKRLRAALISEASSFPSLNFFSNNSKSKNLARISLRRVEPSLIKDSEPIWLDIDVIRKSSRVPNTFLIFLSVSVRLRPFKDSSSPVTLLRLTKLTSVFDSNVTSPLSFFVYFSETLSII